MHCEVVSFNRVTLSPHAMRYRQNQFGLMHVLLVLLVPCFKCRTSGKYDSDTRPGILSRQHPVQLHYGDRSNGIKLAVHATLVKWLKFSLWLGTIGWQKWNKSGAYTNLLRQLNIRPRMENNIAINSLWMTCYQSRHNAAISILP